MTREEQCGDTIFDRLPEDRALGVVVKISERCNLTCSYCYFFFGGDESYKIHSPTMRGDAAEALVKFIVDAVRTYRLKSVQLTLHGGEPLLMKKPAFDKLCRQLRESIDPLCKLLLLTQTNGVLVDDEWIEIFQRHRVNVGFSFDGDQEAHDVYRLDKKGRGTYAESRRGWELLKAAAHDKRVNEPGILCVVSPERSGAALYDHFARELRARHIDFLLPDLCHTDNVSPDFVKGCGDYLRAVFRAWTEHDPKNVHVRFITEAYRSLLSDIYARARRVRGQDVAQLLIVRSNGEITPVDKLSTVSDRFNTTGLNVKDVGLGAVIESAQWREIRDACEHIPTGCQGCAWQHICRGGPINTRYSKERQFDNPSIYCAAYQELFTDIARSFAAAGASWDDMTRRMRGLEPERATAELSREPVETELETVSS